MKFNITVLKLLTWALMLGLIFLVGCAPAKLQSPVNTTPQPSATTQLTSPSNPQQPSKPILPTETPAPTATATLSPTPDTGVPAFSHIVVIVLENHEFGSVIGSSSMPIFNDWANKYTLLSQIYAIRHPSLPNYMALIGGDTFGLTKNCTDCVVNAPSLPDLIEASGRTWKAYMEDMPEPCYVGDTDTYVQKHNPFMYFDPIRLNQDRCTRSVVPFTQLDADLEAGDLPDFVFISPNQCHNAHSCDEKTADLWLGTHVPFLLAYPEIAQNGLIILTWDEGQGDHGCCGVAAGGRIATVLISPLAKKSFIDDTPYTTYSLLKTISAAWRMPYLGEAAKDENVLITAPWVP